MTDEERRDRNRLANQKYRAKVKADKIKAGGPAPRRGPKAADPENPLTDAPRIGAAIDAGTMARIDADRGTVTRSEWLRQAINEKLGDQSSST